jgi:hypothetical protein
MYAEYEGEWITNYTLRAIKKLVEKKRKGLWRQSSQNSDTTAPSGRELYHLHFSLQAASPETSGYTLVTVFRVSFLPAYHGMR